MRHRGRAAVRYGIWTLGALGSLSVILVVVLVARALMAAAPHPGVSRQLPSDIDAAGVAANLSQAIRFQTVSKAPGVPVDPEAFHAFHDFLLATYPKAHQALELERINHYSLLYRWPGKSPDKDPILLLAHQDVVPPNGEWERPPFSGAIEEGVIWGRGALDDKVSILAILEAVELLLGSGFTPDRTVYLAFGHDEEIDGQNGARAMAELLKERNIRFAFALDEGSPIGLGLVPGLEVPVSLIGTAEKGYTSRREGRLTQGIPDAGADLIHRDGL